MKLFNVFLAELAQHLYKFSDITGCITIIWRITDFGNSSQWTGIVIMLKFLNIFVNIDIYLIEEVQNNVCLIMSYKFSTCKLIMQEIYYIIRISSSPHQGRRFCCE
jgi:hypothetical protein